MITEKQANILLNCLDMPVTEREQIKGYWQEAGLIRKPALTKVRDLILQICINNMSFDNLHIFSKMKNIIESEISEVME